MHASSMWAHVKEEIKVRSCQTFSGLHGSEENPEAQKQLKTKICSHSSWSAHILLLFLFCFVCWRAHDVRLFWRQSNWPGFYMGASVRTEYEVQPVYFHPAVYVHVPLTLYSVCLNTLTLIYLLSRMFERIEMNITGSMWPPCDSVHLQKPTEKSRLIWVSFFLHVAGL